MKRVLLASLIAGTFAASLPAAFAETAGEPLAAAQGATEAAAPQRAAPQQRAFRAPSERVEARIAYLRTALKITDAQRTQFDSFANVLRSHARDMDKRMQERQAQRAQGQRGQPRGNVDAFARLEQRHQFAQQRVARMGEVLNAAKPLYATFSPEQKQIANELLSRGGRGGHGGHRGGHRHGGGHRGA